MVLRETGILIACGLSVGIPLTLVAGKLVASRLFGVSANDPVTIGAAAVLMAGVCGAAALLPALRASRVQPLTALRSD